MHLENSALTRRKESRKRNLQFHLPWTVSLNPSVRIITNDSSYVSLQDMYDRHCEEIGITREEPALLVAQKTKLIAREMGTVVGSFLHPACVLGAQKYTFPSQIHRSLLP